MRRDLRAFLAAALGFALGVPACKRDSPSPAAANASEPAPAPSASAAPAVVRALPADSAAAAGELPRVGEAERGLLGDAAAEPTLAAAATTLREHFGATTDLAFQSATLPGGRRLVLLHTRAGAPKPLLLDVAADKSLVWEKARPLAGIGVTSDQIAIAGGPHGNVVIFFYDAPTHLVGMRVWDSLGGILMDAEVLSTAGCDALSALYWPGHGFVVTSAAHDSVKAELVGEEGRNRWGGREMALARWRATAPVSMMPDTADSVVLFQVGYLAATPGAITPDHLFAMRYDAAGLPLWPGPLDAGRLPARVAPDNARVRLTRPAPGTVHAEIPGLRFSVDVSSMGKATHP